ncbi:MAG: T9SS type A sorting domain-containing protein, partial [Ichthyobacteriaceae bacterium]|nr:T9SS type A sorting domain-containing protein [Ichthyobacteriaceae bacterium]
VPFTTELNVVASEEATVSVVSVVGTQVYAGKAGVIDTQAWKSGVYFVVVAEGDAQKVIKVIK